MSRREQILIVAGLVVVLLVVFNYVVYQPKAAEYRELTTERDARQARLAEVQRIAAQAEELERRYQEKQALIATLEAKLPTEKEVPALLVQLERLVTSLGVGLDAIRPGALEAVSAEQGGTQPGTQAGQAGAQAQPTYFRFPIGLSFKGSFNQMVALTGALQDFPRLIAVTRISMNPTTLPELAAQVDSETYVLPKEAR